MVYAALVSAANDVFHINKDIFLLCLRNIQKVTPDFRLRRPGPGIIKIVYSPLHEREFDNPTWRSLWEQSLEQKWTKQPRF